MGEDQQTVFNSLRDKGPEAWREYLRQFEGGAPLTGLSMLVIFHYAAPLATEQNNVDWAEVAIRAAEIEARHCNGIEREGALLWAMNLRSWFICKMGSRPGHFVLDKSVILVWIESGLRLPLQTAEAKAKAIHEKLAGTTLISDPEVRRLTGQDLSELRWIKHRLNAAKVLADCGELTGNPALNEWLEIREQLP